MSRDPLAELIDREQIRELLARYPMAYDDRDWATWDTFWTDDLVWAVEGREIKGLDAVREFMINCNPPDYQGKHLCGNPAIDLEPDGTSASARTDVVWIAQNYEASIVARYVDTLVKRDGQWRISRREEVLVPFAPGSPPMSDGAAWLTGPGRRPPDASEVRS